MSGYAETPDAPARDWADSEVASIQAVGTIDLTPTWAEVARIIEVCLIHGTPEGREAARGELRRMAEAADRYNASLGPVPRFVRTVTNTDGDKRNAYIESADLVLRDVGGAEVGRFCNVALADADATLWADGYKPNA